MKLSDERLREIVATNARHAAEAGKVWVSEDETHAMARELVELRQELKYYRDNYRGADVAKEYDGTDYG